MSDFAKFMTVNRLKRKDIAAYLGVSGAFVSQITSGDRPLPEEKLAKIKANAYGWDVSMLTAYTLEGLDKIRPMRSASPVELKAAVEKVMTPEENFLIDYLERKVEDKDRLIQELYQKIGILEAKLEFARKGETANIVDGSLSADAV